MGVSNKMDCPINKKHKVILVEYWYDNPNRYDGISEISCKDCGKRYGRWTNNVLKENEFEPPYGDSKLVTNEFKHYNL